MPEVTTSSIKHDWVTLKDKLVILTCIVILSFLTMISVIGANAVPYRVTVESIDGHRFAVFRSSNGSICVEELK